MPRVAVLRCRDLPSFVTWEIPDVEALFTDDRLLLDAFAQLGADAEPVVWSDPVDWDAFDLAVLRSTWDYIDAADAFDAAMARIHASSCRLVNPLDAVRWNRDKRYLLDLQSRGVPVVPTIGAWTADPGALQERALAEGWAGAVLKPRVGAGGADVRRVAVTELAEALAASGDPDDVLLQPLAEAVMAEGELSFVFLGGELSHTLLKRPAAGDFRAHGIYGGTVERSTASVDDIAEAAAIMAAVGFDLVYARLDAVRFDGRLAVMELELVEPMLYLDLAPGSADRLARAALALLPPSKWVE